MGGDAAPARDRDAGVVRVGRLPAVDDAGPSTESLASAPTGPSRPPVAPRGVAMMTAQHDGAPRVAGDVFRGGSDERLREYAFEIAVRGTSLHGFVSRRSECRRPSRLHAPTTAMSTAQRPRCRMVKPCANDRTCGLFGR